MNNNLIRKTKKSIFLVIDVINCKDLKASAITACFSKKKNALSYIKKYYNVTNNLHYNNHKDKIQIQKIFIEDYKSLTKLYFVYEVANTGDVLNIKCFNNKKDSVKHILKYYYSNIINGNIKYSNTLINKKYIKERRYFYIKNDNYMVKISKISLDKE